MAIIASRAWTRTQPHIQTCTLDSTEIVELLVKECPDPAIKNNAQIWASELGARLRRRDSLDILTPTRKRRGPRRRVRKALWGTFLRLPIYYHNPLTSFTVLCACYTLVSFSMCPRSWRYCGFLLGYVM